MMPSRAALALVAAAAAAAAAAACFLQVSGDSPCQVNRTVVAGGQCPITLCSTPLIERGGGYSEIITFQVRMKSMDYRLSPKIELDGRQYKELFWPKRQCRKQSDFDIRCSKDANISMHNLEYDFKAQSRHKVSVSYSSKSINCTVYYHVPAPRPDFNLSVNKTSKSISVDVDSGDPVYVRWCYERSRAHCSGGLLQLTNRLTVLSIPYLLPCVCVEVYYTYTDAARHKKCPFRNESLIDIRDILQSSEVGVFKSHLEWSSECPACSEKVSAALCWNMHRHACIPIPNSTLERESETALFKISTVDKHPQICVQFSIGDVTNISCFFEEDKPSWETSVTPGRQSVTLHISSTVTAKFSAQLCILTESGCLPQGQIYSETMATSQTITVPIKDITERPCVQVWQSAPLLIGRRVLCPDYAHKRWGVHAVGVLVFAGFGLLLGFCIHRATKSGLAGWLTIRRPLLLVCSSDRSAHVSAVCALASILQEELDASVHTALWAQSSQTKAGNVASVADLGPMPWLYGQWEAIRKAQGKMLIVWSPEAKKTYQRWRVEKINMDNSWKPDNVMASIHDYLKNNGWGLGKLKKEKCIEKTSVECFEDEDSKRDPSTVIKPVFVAALASLEGALQEGRGKDAAIVYFHGLCHSRDIPQALRAVPRYCLPQEFRGLIQELAKVKGKTKSGELKWLCWSRLLSKVLSVWLARQLTRRLQTVLPWMREQTVSSSIKMPSDQTESRWELPLSSKPSSRQEQELLHGSPLGTGRL